MNQHAPFQGRSTFKAVAFADIHADFACEFLVEDIIPLQGVGVFYGESGCGKTFFASDMALAVARAIPWAGKAVIGGVVIYIVAEGVSGFRKRVAAYRERHQVGDDTPFFMISGAPNLGTAPSDIVPLMSAIDEATGGLPIRLIVIDTFARVMGGADENSARDVGVAVGNCDQLATRFGCFVALIHHAGKDASRGARGSSALRAAADTEIFVDGSSERRTAKVMKQRDGEANLTLAFRLEHVELDGAASCILTPLSNWGSDQFDAKPTRKMTDRDRLALNALSDVLLASGTAPPPEWGLPQGILVAPVSAWRDELFTRGVLNKECSNPSSRWHELKTRLMGKTYIAERDGSVWRST